MQLEPTSFTSPPLQYDLPDDLPRHCTTCYVFLKQSTWELEIDDGFIGWFNKCARGHYTSIIKER